MLFVCVRLFKLFFLYARLPDPLHHTATHNNKVISIVFIVSIVVVCNGDNPGDRDRDRDLERIYQKKSIQKLGFQSYV